MQWLHSLVTRWTRRMPHRRTPRFTGAFSRNRARNASASNCEASTDSAIKHKQQTMQQTRITERWKVVLLRAGDMVLTMTANKGFSACCWWLARVKDGEHSVATPRAAASSISVKGENVGRGVEWPEGEREDVSKRLETPPPLTQQLYRRWQPAAERELPRAFLSQLHTQQLGVEFSVRLDVGKRTNRGTNSKTDSASSTVNNSPLRKPAADRRVVRVVECSSSERTKRNNRLGDS